VDDGPLSENAMVASLGLLQMIVTTPVVRERQSRAHEEQGKEASPAE
jgi:hypothetical protein